MGSDPAALFRRDYRAAVKMAGSATRFVEPDHLQPFTFAQEHGHWSSSTPQITVYAVRQSDAIQLAIDRLNRLSGHEGLRAELITRAFGELPVLSRRVARADLRLAGVQ